MHVACGGPQEYAMSCAVELLSPGSHRQEVPADGRLLQLLRGGQADELLEHEEPDEDVEGEVGGRAEEDGRVDKHGVEGQQCLHRS